MSKDSTWDVPRGARTVSPGVGGGRVSEGTRATRREEKLCCKAVRRKHKMAAEGRRLLTPRSWSPAHLPPRRVTGGGDHADEIVIGQP